MSKWLPIVLLALVADVASSAKPNIVVVLADDLGYGDLGCYGNETVQTPHLDAFADQGLRFTQCYSAHPNCSPARAGLMTGRTPFRVGIYNWIPMHSPMHVRRSEITVASMLQMVGYDTCHVGKWHLNGDFNGPSQPQPSDHGFNHWFATQNNALPNHRNPVNFVRNGDAVGRIEGYAASIVANEAVQWLRNVRDPSRPFFLFVCFHEPHEPIASAKRYTDLYPSDDPSYSAHHGNVTQLDDGFGILLSALEEIGANDNTLVLFTSDNGPAITPMHPHGSAGPLRDKKGAIYEGGIRVPGIVRWPGHVSAGVTSDVPVSGVDLFPTLCEVVESEPPQDRVLDGASWLPVLRGETLTRSKPLYWHFNRAKSDVKVAIRENNWKLVAGLSDPGPNVGADITPEEMDRIQQSKLTGFRLYDLSQDVAETTDVSEQHADTFERMKSQMIGIYRDVLAEAPRWPAWEWPRYESSRIQWPEYWLNRKRPKVRK